MSVETLTLSIGGESLPVERATLEYLTDVPSGYEWERRGFKATRYTRRDRLETEDEIGRRIEQDLQRDSIDRALRDFCEEAHELYRNLIEGNLEAVRGRFGDREFLFIAGAPRTGGTYFLREFFRLQDDELSRYNKKMTMGLIPIGSYLLDWRDPEETPRLMFDLAQWLLWVERELGHLHTIPKKHIAFPHALSFLDELFGRRATYVVTNRHPGEIARSYGRRVGVEDPTSRRNHGGIEYVVKSRTDVSDDAWASMTFNEKILLYWSTLYREMASVGPLEGTLRPVSFGTPHEELVRSYASEWGVDHRPEPFSPSEYELDDFWSRDRVQSTIRDVRRAWENRYDTWPGW